MKNEGRYNENMDYVSDVAPEHTEKQTVKKILSVKTAESDIILPRFMWIHFQLLQIEHPHQFIAGRKLPRNGM